MATAHAQVVELNRLREANEARTVVDGGRAAVREHEPASTDATGEAAPHHTGKGATMTSQTAPIAAAPKHHRTWLITAAAGAFLALTTAAGIGAWQMSRDGGTTSGEQQVASLPASAPAPVQQVAASRAADAAPTYYLVASSAHAAVITATLGEANSARANEWVYLVNTQAEADALRQLDPESVVVVADADQAAVWLRVLDDMDPQRFRLIDRRYVRDATTPNWT